MEHMIEEEKGGTLKSLIRFHSANITDKCNAGVGGVKSKRFYRTSQNIKITNVFLESLLSKSFPSPGSQSPPHLPRMPSNTVLIPEPVWGQLRF